MGALKFIIHDEFEEAKHPRVPGGSAGGGQFTSGGGGGAAASKTAAGPSPGPASSLSSSTPGVINSHIVKLLTGKGFKKVAGTAFTYKHPSGNLVTFHPPDEGKKSTSKWQHYLEGGEKQRGFGLALEKLIGHLGEPGAKTAESIEKAIGNKTGLEELSEVFGDPKKTDAINGYKAVLGHFFKGSGTVSEVSKATQAATNLGISAEELNKIYNEYSAKWAAEVKAAQKSATPAPKAKVPAPPAPLTMASLKKVGEKLGSNEGGTYEDATGNKFYVKNTKSPSHAANENLAASLYQLAGVKTLTYRQATDNPSAVATEWEKLGSDSNGFIGSDKAKAKEDFAIHAWLANWDVTGVDGKNLARSADGSAIKPVDLGGSLLYRAQGKPKGDAFGNEVTEWKTLRDPMTNQKAAAIFGDMTSEELKASAAKLATITEGDIRSVLEQSPLGQGAAGEQLVQKLLKRQEDIQKKAAAQGAAKVEPAKPTKPAAPELSPQEKVRKLRQEEGQAEVKAVIDQHQADATPKLKRWNGAAPKHTATEASAIHSYRGAGYDEINNSLRHHGNIVPKAQAIRDFLSKAQAPEDAVFFRGVPAKAAASILNMAIQGQQFQDKGIVSVSSSPGFSKSWGSWNGTTDGGLFMKVNVKKGQNVASITGNITNNHSEYELLIQSGSRFHVKKLNRAARYMEVDLIQDHFKGEDDDHE